MKRATIAILTAIALIPAACTAQGVKGTYSNGATVLELKDGGKARLVAMGEAQDCTYEVKKESILLACDEGPPAELIRTADGSLSAGWLGLMKKQD